MAHNPPASELLDLTDRMGFLVINESFDMWERKKTPLDSHLIYPDWHEQDMRALVRRDRNHPSVIMWSTGNEGGEQYTDIAGAVIANRLHAITKEEDPTRPTAASMNYAKPHMPLPAVMDTITLNYQGEGIRNAPAYAHLQGIRTSPLYPAFHAAFPDKIISSSENAAAISSRGEYLFPVSDGISAPVADGFGGDPVRAHVSAYELYTAPFGSSADKVLGSLARHPFVAGGFVWSGWDYLGEPTPYYSARSSYFGVIDLAGSPRIASSSTKPTGASISPWSTSCPTGPGPNASAKSHRSTSSRPETRPNSSSAGNLWTVVKRVNTNSACAGTMSPTSPVN
ncbi:MAG: hypothetical protein J6386_09510 [Candidatus Synoicihabitans palmerolidicus]|nr:hypothetical protein [Candidatus Synoicihabitans palmerolidicus]